MTVANKYTPALSRFPTDSSNDSELDAAVMTPPDRTTSRTCRVASRGGVVPAHSPDGHFVGEYTVPNVSMIAPDLVA